MYALLLITDISVTVHFLYKNNKEQEYTGIKNKVLFVSTVYIVISNLLLHKYYFDCDIGIQVGKFLSWKSYLYKIFLHIHL